MERRSMHRLMKKHPFSGTSRRIRQPRLETDRLAEEFLSKLSAAGGPSSDRLIRTARAQSARAVIPTIIKAQLLAGKEEIQLGSLTLQEILTM
ncbi:MAG: hypothetical protein ACLR7N_03825 [Roseburia hominis]